MNPTIQMIIKKTLFFTLFLIGVFVFSTGLLSILPDFGLTELGKNNANILMGKLFILNFSITICGMVTTVKALQKL